MYKFVTISRYYLEKLLMLILVSFPVLALILKKWMNACLFTASLISFLLIVVSGSSLFRRQVFTKPWVKAISVALFSPVFGLLVVKVIKGQISAGNIDSLSKLFLAIPVFYWILLKPFNPLIYFKWSIPCAVLFTYASIWISPNLDWTTDGVVRITTYFVDPLSFGALTMGLALICLAMLDFKADDNLTKNLFILIAFFAGIYLSLLSGSRSSWLAIIPALWLWLKHRCLLPGWLIVVLLSAVVGAAFVFLPFVRERILQAISEIGQYSWSEINHDTSVEMRLTFYRIGWELFKLSPWLGWGDYSFASVLNEPRFTLFASDFTRQFVLGQGFHNELITNMVRSGVCGLIPLLMVFSLPMWVFLKALGNDDVEIKGYGLLATNYYLSVLITSLTTEVFNIKFVSSFNAMMLAIFCGVIINKIYQNGSKEYDR